MTTPTVNLTTADTNEVTTSHSNPFASHALASLWLDAGLSRDAPHRSSLPGGDPVLPSSFRPAAAAQASNGAAALAGWSAEDFETASAEAGLMVAALRSFEKWDRHPRALTVFGHAGTTGTAFGAARKPSTGLARIRALISTQA